MTEQPGDVLDEAVKLFESLWRRIGGTGGGDRGARGAMGEPDEVWGPATSERPAVGERPAAGDVWSSATSERPVSGDARGPATGSGAGSEGGGDVWGRATAGDPHIATGAPECRDCPVCQAIRLARESGPDVTAHVRRAGQSLMAAAYEVFAAFERERDRGPRPPHAGGQPGNAGGNPGNAGGSSGKGGSPFAGRSPTGNDPIDIG